MVSDYFYHTVHRANLAEDDQEGWGPAEHISAWYWGDNPDGADEEDSEGDDDNDPDYEDIPVEEDDDEDDEFHGTAYGRHEYVAGTRLTNVQMRKKTADKSSSKSSYKAVPTLGKITMGRLRYKLERSASWD
jgi:hypothetical protein